MDDIPNIANIVTIANIANSADTVNIDNIFGICTITNEGNVQNPAHITTIQIEGISQNMDISKIHIFAKISYFWSLTVPICRSRAPESKSGIETEPNGRNGGQK